MQLTVGLKRFFSFFFIGTLLLSTVQITVTGYESDENSMFRILTTILAEEENEDSESEGESKCSKKYMVHVEHLAIVDSNKYLRSLDGQQFFFTVIREVFSPPPEA